MTGIAIRFPLQQVHSNCYFWNMIASGKHLLHTITFVLLFFVFCLNSSFGQTLIKPQVLDNAEWQGFFAKHFHLKNIRALKTTVAPGDIPYPTVWKYEGDIDKEKKGKYLLFPAGPDADFLVMPSNNNVGTYLLYFNYPHPEKDFVEMNFMADSVICRQVTKDIFMFQFNDDGFKIGGDSSGFKRYIFVSTSGRLASKSLVAHTCVVTLNSVDTVRSLVYLYINYNNGAAYKKNFRFDYHNYLLLTDLNDMEDLNGSIVIDSVHYCPIKSVEEATK